MHDMSEQSSGRKILHIDFDSFFASVEQQYNPVFRGKPLGVTATNGRTCIIAASREAKRFGVKTAMNVYKAETLCPDLLLTPANFVRYWEVSKKFINICKDFSPSVEVFSIDELFMDITKTEHLFGGVYGLISKLKKRIENEIGPYITVSVGVSHNKLLAKLGSGLKKPNGIVTITPHNLSEIYAHTELTEICGIGSRICRRLHRMGIYTLPKLSLTTKSSLMAEFGVVEGTFLWNVGQGIDFSEVNPYTETEPAKSIGRQYCLPENEYDERTILQNVYELCEELGIKLRRIKMKARHMGISLGGGSYISVHKTFSSYFDTGQEMYDIVYRLLSDPSSGFRTLPEEIRYVRRIGVYVSFLSPSSSIPLDLFSDVLRKNKIAHVIDTINDRFGDHTIRNGFLLDSDKLTTVPNGFGPDAYEREKLVRFGL